jgi:hypothetical protein
MGNPFQQNVKFGQFLSINNLALLFTWKSLFSKDQNICTALEFKEQNNNNFTIKFLYLLGKCVL